MLAGAALTGAMAAPAAAQPAEATIRVTNAHQLQRALDDARPGTTISLADGTYDGRFTMTRSGTEDKPITITGGRGAVLDGGKVASGYVLHLDRARYVHVHGLTVRNGQKAVVLDSSSHDVLSDLDLSHTGDEVLVLRNGSRDNRILRNEVHDAGLVEPGYGEGIYVGQSESNWSSSSSRTHGRPDTSNRNVITGNWIHDTAAEGIDIKEGTSGGVVSDNTFDSRGLTGNNYADSWVDVAGNDYLISGNHGVNAEGSALADGYQTHVILPGWGRNNTFQGNQAAVDASGYAVKVQDPLSTGNVVAADNTQSGARQGLTNARVAPTADNPGAARPDLR